MYSIILRSTLILAALGLFVSTAAVAQSSEEQAKAILKLYESGQKDSAYALIEPLKKSARFVPAVLFVRAQMTPDDRALNLYRETIAIEPGGVWADQAAFELVRRYADKHDSLAASTWLNVLKSNYPRSSRIAAAEDLLHAVTEWRPFDEMSDPVTKKETGRNAKGNVPAKKTVEPTPTKATKPAAPKDGTKKESATGATPRNLRGYALQVGIFPSRELADARVAELKKRNLRVLALPKSIDGKKQYALVIGPYATKEEADKKKNGVATACDCQAFVVKVE